MPGFPPSRLTDPVSHDGLTSSGTVTVAPPGRPVIIEGLLAAPVTSQVSCSGTMAVGIAHPPVPAGNPNPTIVVGAATVLINNMPAARWFPSGDIVACDAKLGVPPPGVQRSLIGGISTLEQALQDLRALLLERLVELLRWNEEDQKRFKTWFGKNDVFARFRVMGIMMRMLALSYNYNTSNFKGADVNDGDYDFYAQVLPSDPSTIELANTFGSSSRTGDDSRASTIAHEMSHFDIVGGTDDVDVAGTTMYGTGNCRTLATNDPNSALNNADNYAYWVEGLN